jgi:hypothetical protein
MDSVVEEIFSEDRKLRIEIRRRTDGNLQLFALYRFDDEDIPEYGRVPGGWAPLSIDVTICDTLERARDRAQEILRVTSKPAVVR